LIKRILLTLALVALTFPAWAQAYPDGQGFTPGHTIRCSNSTCTTFGDAGGATGSSKPGQKYLTELGITASGAPFCVTDALTNAVGGYHQLCLGANALGGGLISFNAYGGASALPLNCNINGSVSSCLSPIGNIAIPTSTVAGGSSTGLSYGLLFNKNGFVGDSNSDTSLSNGIAGQSVTISSNAASGWPNIATTLGGGGAPPLFRLGTKDEGETIFQIASFGTNATSTIDLYRTNGTAASPTPLLNDDVISAISTTGQAANGANGSGSLAATQETRACENWTLTGNCVTFLWFANLAGQSSYTGGTGPTGLMQLNAGGLGGLSLGGVFNSQGIGGTPDFGVGTLSQSGGHFINANAAAFNSAPSTTLTHIAQADTLNLDEVFDTFGAATSVLLRRADGTGASPTAIQSGDVLGAFGMLGENGTAYSSAVTGSFQCTAAQNWTNAHEGTGCDLFTTPLNSTTPASAVHFFPSGGIGVGESSTDPGLGSTYQLGGAFINANAAAFNSAPSQTLIHVAQADTFNLDEIFDTFGAATSVTLRRADGTGTSPTAVQSGDALGSFGMLGENGTAYASAVTGAFQCTAAQNWTSAHEGTSCDIFTTPLNSIVPASSLHFFASGGIGVGETGTDPGIGAIEANSISFGGGTLNTYTASSNPTTCASGTEDWTPVITTSGTAGTPAYTTQCGSRIIVGNLVTVWFSITLSGWTGSPTGNVSISGLPVAAANSTHDTGICSIGTFTVTGLAAGDTSLSGYIQSNTQIISLQQNGNTGSSNVTVAQFGTTGSLSGSCSYHT
jgi:hypothetical protein